MAHSSARGGSVEAAAQAGDREAFGALFDRCRLELQVHCYRMLGSFVEAEDLVQETFERAWRGLDRFEGSSSMRVWLYRIATNACLDALRQRGRRRVLPFDVMEPVRPDRPLPDADELWLEPFPGRVLSGRAGDAGADPGETVVHRETIELVFIAAIQRLPPRQRAVFIARDVLGWSAKATATLLDTSEASVKSALQRARATIKEHLPQRRDDWSVSTTEVGRQELEILQRYIDAHQRDDIEALAQALADDVRVAYPQIPLWSDSRAAFIQATREFAPPGEYRFVVTSANLQPAVAIYHRAPGEPRFRLTALEVVRIEGGRITEIVDFSVPHLYGAFGLAPSLP